jgi:hypothetical protein
MKKARRRIGRAVRAYLSQLHYTLHVKSAFREREPGFPSSGVWNLSALAAASSLVAKLTTKVVA